MKDINFVSNANGLAVKVPASAVPNPSCDKIMCQGELSGGCEPALSLSPPGVRQAQRFSLVFEAIEGQTIVEMAGGSWSAGEAPDGVPANYVALEAGNNGDGDGYFLIDTNGDVSTFAAPEVTITSPDGTEVFNGLITYQGSGVFSITLDVPLNVVAGVVYCVTVETTGLFE